VDYTLNSKRIAPDKATLMMSYIGPDQNLIEEMTLREHVNFHFQFKKTSLSFEEIIKRAGLSGSESTFIKEFSSGMKQRLKFALAIFSDAELLLLDEPTAFMDAQGFDWYRNEMSYQLNTKTIIIASNQTHEYDFISNIVLMENYKT